MWTDFHNANVGGQPCTTIVHDNVIHNGRNDWEQFFRYVLDPSAVIGRDDRSRLPATDDGRMFTGLPVTERKQREILKIQGANWKRSPAINTKPASRVMSP